MEIVVRRDGDAYCVYAESIPVHAIGLLTIKRASHVEPDSEGKWIADLSPVDGPMLGPFENRTEAINKEVAWLKLYWLDQS